MRLTTSTMASRDRSQRGKLTTRHIALLLMVAASTPGCRLFVDEVASEGRSPLQPVSASADSVSLEIFWARYSPDDAQLNQTVWGQIDEGQISAATRRLLAENGLRAGVVGANVPPPLARVLALEDKSAQAEEANTDQEQQLAELLVEPSVTRRRRQLQSGTRLEVQASEVVPQMPLLVSRAGELSGRTYTDAQVLYALQIESRADRTVSLEVVPELHFGPPMLRYSAGDGILRQRPLRDREVFSDLKMSVTLAPGEMLVVAGEKDATSRLGHYFHSVESSSAGREQKLIVIRLAQVPESQAFANSGRRWPW